MFHKYPTTIVVLLSLSIGGIAQNLPDAPSTTLGNVSSNGIESKPVIKGAAPAGRGPWLDMADSRYWAATTALFGTTIVNVEMTARCAEQRTCLTEIAPGSNRAKLYAYTLPTDVALSILAYKLKSRSRWLWALPPLAFTAANLFSAGRSYGRIR